MRAKRKYFLLTFDNRFSGNLSDQLALDGDVENDDKNGVEDSILSNRFQPVSIRHQEVLPVAICFDSDVYSFHQ